MPDDDLDLDAAQRARITELFAGIASKTHYEVLGVDPGADKKAIKRAYFDLTPQFHPDRFFRKRLGAYKPMLEAIFVRLTEASEVLTDSARRAEYDEYLASQARARGIEAMLRDLLAEMNAADAAVREAVPEPAPLTIAATPASPAAPTSAPRAGTPSSPSLDERVRREALARRLLHGRTPPTAQSSQPRIAARPQQTPAEAMDALRRRYEERVAAARASQAKRYRADAEAAVARNDTLAAATAYRVALSLAPDDAELKRKSEEAQRAANTILAESYTKQASYEEKNGQHADAAKSWQRVVAARADDAHAHDRAAACIVRAAGDLHAAARLAQRACALDRNHAAYRVTLAVVYIAAGLLLNAKRELEAAAQLSPTDDTIPSLLKRIEKG